MKMKRRKRVQKNQGNSFIMVVATVSFLMVLLAAILVAVALCYRLKAYDINTRDNFYYLEQAMDELYAGVGGDTMKILNQAYDDTLEAMVYYDTTKKTYVTMDNDEANKLLKGTYMNMVKNDARYSSKNAAALRLYSFISNKKTASNPEGVSFSLGGYDKDSDDDSLTLYQIVLRREAGYSTVNAREAKRTTSGVSDVAGKDTFVQTITTDLVIGKPKYEVNFNSTSSDMNVLYTYSMIADMGIEIYESDSTGKIKTALGDRVNITGNVYAASDFYNKGYNENPNTVVTAKNASGNSASTTVKAEQIQKVCFDEDDRQKSYNGVDWRSMYSGIYIDGATVIMSCDRVIVPGMIAALNCADVTISSVANSSSDYTDIWADGIVLDGYALKQNADGTKKKGAALSMKAKAYIYDDLEVNSNSSEVMLNGQYYGYNFASTDNRTYSESALSNKRDGRVFTSNPVDGIKDGQGIIGQAHYNSSAIILNGEDTKLDFSLVNAMYIAGQSYIETSKSTNYKKDADTNEDAVTTLSYNVKDDKGTVTSLTDDVKEEVNSYTTQKTDTSGKVTDNYTVDNDANTPDKTPIQDYRTGEAISIKSNQLAYVPNWTVHDEDDGLYLAIPEGLKTNSAYTDIWSNMDKIPLVKTVISGKTYYFLDFSKADLKDENVMNEFIADYAAMFDESTVTSSNGGKSDGEIYNMVDITDYEYFKVKELIISSATDDTAYDNIYTNSAITTKTESGSFKIKASSSNVAALKKAMANINSAIEEGTNVQTKVAESTTPSVFASSITNKLQDQYKEVKWLLTNSSSSGQYVAEAHTLAEEVITPINHFFDFSKITTENSRYCSLESGYGVWISAGDVKVGTSQYTYSYPNTIGTGVSSKTLSYDTAFTNNKVRGVIIAKGNVSFETDVDEFEGLIVCGGKIIINNFEKSASKVKNSMSLSANEEVVKTVLKECDYSQDKTGDKNVSFVCDIFRLYESQYKPATESGKTEVETMKNISAVQFEDILSLRNWQKNVD